MNSKTQFLILGSGTPNCVAGRAQQSAAVIVNDQPYIIDCGGGVVQRIAEAVAMGVTALEDAKLTRVFITHLHPDHTVGLADLMIAPWVKTRIQPLQIYGPKGTREMVENLLDAFKVGIDEHINGLAALPAPLNVEVYEFEAGMIYSDNNIAIEAFNVRHGRLAAFGFKLVTEDKVIVHSGDTCAVPVMAQKAKGCDILIHEVYCQASLMLREPGWRRYHQSAHTSTYELAEIANKAQPKLLILNHYMTWGYFSDEKLLEEIGEQYHGRVVIGRDLDLFD